MVAVVLTGDKMYCLGVWLVEVVLDSGHAQCSG